MSSPRVWGPRVTTMTIEDLDAPGGPRHIPMTRTTTGHWSCTEAPAGRYWLIVDGERLPDPASPAQPQGFDGPSALDDQPFAWTDQTWTGLPLRDCVLYELHVGTFTAAGTFDGVTEHLDHLVELGIDAIELMPVNTFPGDRGWGYDGVLLAAPHSAYGGPAGLRRLVDSCHARNIAVVLDVVYNHFGPLGNHLERFGPYLSNAHHTPWGQAVDLDGPDSAGVREFIIANATRWVRDFHIDGLRLDAVHTLIDTSPTHIVADIATAVHALGAAAGRTTWVIVESDLNEPHVVRPIADGGWGTDASWSDDFHHALHGALTGEQHGYYSDYGSVAALAKSISSVYVFDGQFSGGRQRLHGQPVGDLDRSHFLAYAQTHDQVGNRHFGERLGHLVSPAAAQIAAALTLTSPCVPMLFQGEEWAASTPFTYFAGHPDETFASLIRDGRQRDVAALSDHPSGTPDALTLPDPFSRAAFDRCVLDWAELGLDPHATMLHWYRALIDLRQRHGSLRDGNERATNVRFDEAGRWLHITRGQVVIVANLGEVPAEVPAEHATSAILLTNNDRLERGDASWLLPPLTVVIAT